MELSQSQLESVLGPLYIGPSNQYIGKCPFCHKSDHFYINRDSYLWDCKKCSEDGNIIVLLKLLGRLDLIKFKESVKRDFGDLFDDSFLKKEEELKIEEVPDYSMPIGYKRIYSDLYLKQRGFVENDFKCHEVGKTSIIPSLEKYLLFPIRQDGNIKGYVARLCVQSNALKRYDNPTAVPFGSLLYGIDEINEETDTVYIGEGIFDKFNIQKGLNFLELDNCVALCSFGKKLSDNQIYLLKLKNIKKIVLFYDPDAISSINKYIWRLNENMFETEICFNSTFKNEKGELKDPGELNIDEMAKCLQNKYSPFIFSRKFII